MTVEQKLTKEIDEAFIELSTLDPQSAGAYVARRMIKDKILKRSRLTIGEAQADAVE